MDPKESILLNLLNSSINKTTISQIESNYLVNLKHVRKWKCFTDYCFDDKNKANNVVTFSIIPYITDYFILEAFLKEKVRADLKNSKTVHKDFIQFLNKYPLINFSFILNDRKKLFGETAIKQKENLLSEYSRIKEQYQVWISNEPDKIAYYSGYIKKINACLNDIRRDKKIKIYIDILLVSFLGAYVSNLIVSRVNHLETFGWFSDRDRIGDIEDSLVLYLFHNNLHGLMNSKNFNFAATPARSTTKIFYEEYIKIPDYIAGTLADYNMKDNLISKEKFDTILTDYMADNTYNNYVFRIFKDDNAFKCSRIDILKKAD